MTIEEEYEAAVEKAKENGHAIEVVTGKDAEPCDKRGICRNVGCPEKVSLYAGQVLVTGKAHERCPKQ